MTKEQETDLINEAKASAEGEALSQYTIHITRDQAQAIHGQLVRRREVGARCSFSDLIRELIDTGFQHVMESTDTIRTMRGKRVQVKPA
jgi:hypothetical protein